MHSELPELPDLAPGITLLETDVRGALPALVVDRVLGSGGRALWADANGHARTRAVADVAPSPRVLRRIDVARGFTAFQHYAIVEAVAERADEVTGDGTPEGESPAILVAPAIDAPYRDDALRGEEGRGMLVRALAALAGAARRHDCPVLVTRTAADGLAAPVANAAGETIHCERTPMGPRFAAEDFETLVYPAGDGYVQTTIAFWRRVLARRAPDAALGDAGVVAVADGDVARAGSDAVAAVGGDAPLATDGGVTGQPLSTVADPAAPEVIARGAD